MNTDAASRLSKKLNSRRATKEVSLTTTNTMNHAAKIAIYTADENFRYIDLYWNERLDSVIIKENERTTTILVKPDATLMDALVALGYNENLTLDIYEPSLMSRRDQRDYLNRILLTIEGARIVLSQVGCCFAGKPAMVGW